MRRIDCEADIVDGLAALAKCDPRLVPVIDTAGLVPLRRSEPGLASLVSIIVSQQVSRASAEAIHGRLTRLLDPLNPQTLYECDDDIFRQAGLSRPKQRTMRALAGAIIHDGLDLHGLCRMNNDRAIAQLTMVSGIGPWTAEVYLLFAAGHPDVFPAKDVALQNAVGDAFGHAQRPTDKALAVIAEQWSPWRGVAARLFWAYHAATRGSDGAPVESRSENKDPD
jgi:DNA-3-methyladenine glycosylase II